MTEEERRAAALRRARRREGSSPRPQARLPGLERFAVVTCYFDWAGFARPQQNLRRFVRQMDALGVPVHGMSLHLSGEDPVFAGRPGWTALEVGPEAVMWQKEALCNAVVARLPREVEHVAILDSDLWYDSPRWALDAVATLRERPVAQAFSRAVWTGRRGEAEKSLPAVTISGHDAVRWPGHTGFGWCFRRDFLERIGGLYAVGSMGTLDVALVVALLGCPPGSPEWRELTRKLVPRNEGHYRRWYDGVREALRGELPPGAVPGTVYHEWHGTLADRGYNSRHELIAEMDVARHIAIHDEGHLVWTDAAPMAMRRRVAGYFRARREDG